MVSRSGPDIDHLNDDEREWYSDIWVTLILMMLSWFLLHDFDPVDVKTVPSTLKGSRIPVYIG